MPRDIQHRQARCPGIRAGADHGKPKRLVRPTLGRQPMRTACATIEGIEVMRALTKRHGSPFRFRLGVAGEVDLVNRNFDLG